ncbi:MAG: RNA-binding protein [Halothiobacillaceae bacterium]|nr:MAG: RNA-binding protein [Halothiobacillaceae bacterium]
MINIYVGNLSFRTDDEALRQAFDGHGEIASAKVVMDRDTGRSKGFGFVEMPNREEALAAIKALDGQELDGRALRVNEARPREERPRTGGGGGGRDGFAPRPRRF